MTVAYVGNHAEHVMASRQFNPAVYTGRPVRWAMKTHAAVSTAWARLNWPTTYEYEMTNALEANVTRRASHGLTLLANVVWMKTIDNGSSGTEGQPGRPIHST